jgi:AraC-like DNA-binding protein
MQATLPIDAGRRLERLCERRPGARGDRIRIGLGAAGIERLEAHFHGQPFSPHRHDSYAIGLTLSGVQIFRYRGAQRHSLPGQCQILHPDEMHDGGAGTDEGFGYRIVYVDPSLVRDALGGGPLPFVKDPAVDSARLPKEVASEIWNIDQEIDDVARIDFAATVADMLCAASSDGADKSGSLDLESLSRTRDAIATDPARRYAMEALERLSGLDRWTLARQFRAAFGTSPSRFRTMRQLDQVRRLLKGGASTAAAAIDAGFADQSHMSRQFKRAYGLTPARWRLATACRTVRES